jgi:hypothetical protein
MRKRVPNKRQKRRKMTDFLKRHVEKGETQVSWDKAGEWRGMWSGEMDGLG